MNNLDLPHRTTISRRWIGPLLTLATVLAALLAFPPLTHSATRVDRIPALGKNWFISGSNLPYYRLSCDFGCTSKGGTTGNRRAITGMISTMADNGVKSVRWEVFSGSAPQITRTAAGAPVAIGSGVRTDLRTALDIAEQLDVYITPVLFPDPESLPPTWISDPAQRAVLVSEVGKLVGSLNATQRRHILMWDVVADPEAATEAGTATAADLQLLASELAGEIKARKGGLTMLTAKDVSTVQNWSDVGVDVFGAYWFSAMTDPQANAGQRSARTLGVTKPVVISGWNEPTSAAAALTELKNLRKLGYAGVFGWASRNLAAPRNAGAKSITNLRAHWSLYYSASDVGPRSGPRNPCLGPEAATLRCPDLVMSLPSNFMERRTSSGRTLLLSRNSINSVGAGPGELHSTTRNSKYSMNAVQRIHTKRGTRRVVDTGALLQFKAIPGQYRYWKWKDAATMELWRIDSAGRPTELVRRGPKTVYCLRDLKRTRGGIARSPASQVYPACNQNPRARDLTLGTSVGWSDIYPASYYENWVDITGLPRGCYAYVHIVDPTNVMMESNERNNTSSVSVRLPIFSIGPKCPGPQGIPTEDGGTAYGQPNRY